MKHQVNEQLFFKILKDSEFRCGYCGTDLSDKTLTADYKIPRSLGGEDTLDNLLAACKDCAKMKGHQTVEEFRAGIFEKISEAIDKAYDAYEKVSGLLAVDTDNDVRAALVSAKMIMNRKIMDREVTFSFEEEEIKAIPIGVSETEVRQ